MLGVDKIGEIQRAHYREGRSIRRTRELCRISCSSRRPRRSVQSCSPARPRPAKDCRLRHRDTHRMNAITSDWVKTLEAEGVRRWQSTAKCSGARSPSPRPVVQRAPALREDWPPPRNPCATDNRHQRSIKCYVKCWTRPGTKS